MLLNGIVVSVGSASASLDLEVIGPVRTSESEDLDQARDGISQKEKHSPAFVLPHMLEFVGAQPVQFLLASAEDHMSERYGAEGKTRVTGHLGLDGLDHPGLDSYRAAPKENRTRQDDSYKRAWACPRIPRDSD